jgi:hypothetical protein
MYKHNKTLSKRLIQVLAEQTAILETANQTTAFIQPSGIHTPTRAPDNISHSTFIIDTPENTDWHSTASF